MNKRLAVLMIVVMVASMGLFAAKPETQILQLKRQAAGMSAEDRELLYESNKKGYLPFALNVLLGLGIGSFVQGDSKAGVISLVGDIVGYNIVTFGSSLGGLVGLCIGAGVLIGFRIYECVRSYTFTKSYNKKLQEALKVDSSIVF